MARRGCRPSSTAIRRRSRHLYDRLRQSLEPGPERLLLWTYAQRYGVRGGGVPALLPQVYLHYDPYLRPDPQRRPGAVVRQRMDFLLLLPGRRRVVLEVDGGQHYASDDGTASTARYAQMVREDRRLRLAGYEVYRVGGAEFTAADGGQAMLEDLFVRLLDTHPPACRRCVQPRPCAGPCSATQDVGPGPVGPLSRPELGLRPRRAPRASQQPMPTLPGVGHGSGTSSVAGSPETNADGDEQPFPDVYVETLLDKVASIPDRDA